MVLSGGISVEAVFPISMITKVSPDGTAFTIPLEIALALIAFEAMSGAN